MKAKVFVETLTSVMSGGCEAGLVLVDGWHQLRLEQVASRLQQTVQEAAQQHYRSDRGHYGEL